MPKGIPHSFYLGGPFRWNEDDRAKVQVWMELQAQTCPECGTIPDEWMKDGMPVQPLPYRVESVRCVGCQLIAHERGLISEGGDSDGILLYLVRNDAGFDDQRQSNQ